MALPEFIIGVVAIPDPRGGLRSVSGALIAGNGFKPLGLALCHEVHIEQEFSIDICGQLCKFGGSHLIEIDTVPADVVHGPPLGSHALLPVVV